MRHFQSGEKFYNPNRTRLGLVPLPLWRVWVLLWRCILPPPVPSSWRFTICDEDRSQSKCWSQISNSGITEYLGQMNNHRGKYFSYPRSNILRQWVSGKNWGRWIVGQERSHKWLVRTEQWRQSGYPDFCKVFLGKCKITWHEDVTSEVKTMCLFAKVLVVPSGPLWIYHSWAYLTFLQTGLQLKLISEVMIFISL